MQSDIGIHIISGFPGTTLNHELKYLVKEIKVGGLILFKHNIENPLQLAQLCTSIQRFALESLGRQLFLAIDQEGGRVQRLKSPFTQIPSAEDMGNNGSDAVYLFSTIIAKEMRSVGLNVNLAPVADISSKNTPSFLETRTYGNDPEMVAKYSELAITTFIKNRIIPTIKHFPGLGEAQKDPHKVLPVINSSYQQMEKWELIPFKRAFLARVPWCMTSHAIYTQLDNEFPATLSETILLKILRQNLRFDGIVISDDLEMGALSEFSDFKDISRLAWKASNDLLLVCHDLNNVQYLYEVLEKDSHRQDFKRYHSCSLVRIFKSILMFS